MWLLFSIVFCNFVIVVNQLHMYFPTNVDMVKYKIRIYSLLAWIIDAIIYDINRIVARSDRVKWISKGSLPQIQL